MPSSLYELVERPCEPAARTTVGRRQWLAVVVRSILAAGISALAAVLLWRRATGDCPYPSSVCTACRLRADCTLPKARAARHGRPADRRDG